MTQTRPRLGDGLTAEVQAYADHLSKELGTRISFNGAVIILIRAGLRAAGQKQGAGRKP